MSSSVEKKVKSEGFTLIEMMIVVAIIGILATVAYPSFMAHIIKTRRTEAQNILMQDANFMERLYTQTGCYNPGPDNVCRNGDDAAPLCPPMPFCQSPSTGTAYYAITFANITPTTYTLTVAPNAGTSQVNDGTMTLDNANRRTWDKNPSGKKDSWQ